MKKNISDSRFFTGMNTVVDTFLVGFLWILCSLPIITIGASSTACYYAMVKSVRRGRERITTSFFSCFKSNFKQATVIWLFYLGFLAVAGVDAAAFASFTQPGSFSRIFGYILFVPAIFTIFWVFPYVSRFQNTNLGTIKMVCLIMVRFIGRSILLVVVAAGACSLAIRLPGLIILLPGALCYCFSLIIEPAFKKISKSSTNDDNEDQWYNE